MGEQGVDIPKANSRSRRFWPMLAGIVVLVGLLGVAWARYDNFSNADFANRSNLVIAEVRRADLVREVRAPGNLVPADLRWVAATSSARVETIVLDPGDAVDRDTIVMTLDNPALEQALDSARFELDVLEAELVAMEQRLANERLTQESAVAEMDALYEMAEFRKDANQQLAADRIVSLIALNESVLEERQYKTRRDLEIRRLNSLTALHQAELDAKRARINQSRRALQLQQRLFDELTVRAEFTGHLQDIPVEQGQQVAIGTILARVADNTSLKAELRVQESQVKDVTSGQPVIISAGINRTTGVVRRIEPEVQEGVVIVDVTFDGAPLAGARSDLRVDSIIQLERVPDALTLQRPVFSQENATLSLFVLDPLGQTALRRQVRIGRASTDTIEILEGLQEGERVVVSDTTPFNGLEVLTLR